MKGRYTIGLAGLVLMAACAAQVRGVPASVNSGPTDFSSPRGIPASVSSLGPQGYGSQVVRRNPHSDSIPMSSSRRDRLGRVVLTAPIPLYYYGQSYPVVYLPAEGSTNVQHVSVPQYEPEPQKIIIEIRDARPATPAVDAKIGAPRDVENPAPRSEVELPRAATVFIFQDGSRKELKDFAITQTELIDLSDGLIRRSPLHGLDRAATLKVNAQQGVEVHFPATSSD